MDDPTEVIPISKTPWLRNIPYTLRMILYVIFMDIVVIFVIWMSYPLVGLLTPVIGNDWSNGFWCSLIGFILCGFLGAIPDQRASGEKKETSLSRFSSFFIFYGMLVAIFYVQDAVFLRPTPQNHQKALLHLKAHFVFLPGMICGLYFGYKLRHISMVNRLIKSYFQE
jgi:hypothetical protein